MAAFIHALVIYSTVLAQAPSAPVPQAPPAPPAMPAQTATETAPPPPPSVTAPQYLDRARQLLAGINGDSLPKDAQKTLAQLRTDFDAMSMAYTASLASPQQSPALAAVEERGPTDWQSRFSDVERDLALLVGGGSMLVTRPPASAAGSVDVPDISQLSPGNTDGNSRPTLEGFRTQLELFYDATTRRHPVVLD